MIDKNINVNKKKLNDELLEASFYEHSDIVKYLLTSPELKEHADIHHKNNIGWDALMAACNNGYLDIVKYLLTSSELKEHATIHHKDNYSWNSLMWACQNGSLDIVQYLLTSPELTEHADISHKNNYGWNALMAACNYGYLDVIQYLIIDMNMNVDKENIKWLKGENEDKEVYNHVLKLIDSRNLHQQLDNSIDSDKINKKKITGIKI